MAMNESRAKRVSKMTDKEIKKAVKETYAKVATSSKSCCDAFCCDVPFLGGGTALARMLEYDIENIPMSVTESFAGCGNPVALSDIREGETVLDLGSGAGLDVFVAARKVGDKGRVIGVDMTPEMIEKARMNTDRLGIGNVEFRLGDLEHLPIEDESIDMIISNCVINLTPNKFKAFKEAHRVLRPGGRMFISDIVIEGKLPKKVQESVEAYTACISGALEEEKYLQTIKDAGFVDVKIIGRTKFLDYLASEQIKASKPKK